jgi:ferredoxin-NADP reductase
MVGAGSGVTPFVSILREFHDKTGLPGAPERMTLLVAYRSRNDLISWETLEKVSSPQSRVITTLTREEADGFLHGRPSPDMIDQILNNKYDDTTFMTCGPEVMMEMVTQHAKSRGVPAERIHTESFA